MPVRRSNSLTAQNGRSWLFSSFLLILMSSHMDFHSFVNTLIHCYIYPFIHSQILSKRDSHLYIYTITGPCFLGTHFIIVFSRVLRDSTPRFVRPSVGWSVGRFVGPHFTFFIRFTFLTSPLLPKWSSDLKYGPCPPDSSIIRQGFNVVFWRTSLGRFNFRVTDWRTN